MKTCQICGGRDATTVTEWDGRGVHACDRCANESVPDPDSEGDGLRERLVMVVRRNPGLLTGEAAELLEQAGFDHGLTESGFYDYVAHAMRGLRVDGVLRAEAADGRSFRHYVDEVALKALRKRRREANVAKALATRDKRMAKYRARRSA